jgi:hypothetical protein
MSITEGLLIADKNHKCLMHNNLNSEGTPGTPRALEAPTMKAQTILRAAFAERLEHCDIYGLHTTNRPWCLNHLHGDPAHDTAN